MRPDHHLRRVGIAGFIIVLLILPVSAFTSESLTLTVDSDGSATAIFRFTLEGFVENAIPESVLKEELVKGLAISDETPEVVAFNKSGATIRLKKFALVSDTMAGTEYLTSGMNFTKAEDALKNSAVSSIVIADFTPQITTVIFPDGYQSVFTEAAILPALKHEVIDPRKMVPVQTTMQGSLAVTLSATSAPGSLLKPEQVTATSQTIEIPSMAFAIAATIGILGLAGIGAYYYTGQRKK